MDRIKLFNAPHKALRHLMGEFSRQLGQLHLHNKDEVQRVKKLGLETVLLLKDHSTKEDDVIFAALEAKQTGVTKQAAEEHANMELLLNQVEQAIYDLDTTLSSTQLYKVYLLFSEFQSAYLQHMLEEEKHIQTKLWKHFSNEELSDIRLKLIQNIKPHVLQVWYKHMLPAQTPEENLTLLNALKNHPDQTLYNHTLQSAAEVLPPAQIEYLTSKLHTP